MIDLRSDTVTKPTPKMLEAMTAAQVGDDVFEEDATTNTFQQKIADLFGFEAGLFVPSGVMGNQIALKLLTSPGDEVITDETGHVFNYETTSAALISSIQLHPVEGRRGKINGDLIRGAGRSGQDWEPRSRAVVIENSTNKGGGACYTKEELEEIRDTAEDLGYSIHLDGARIWNAMEAGGIEAGYFGSIADTMTVSFSKGLGAPVGSMILATGDHIQKARRIRKMLGGGMRQIGLLTSAADYAIEHHRALLKEDHRRAKALAETIDGCPQLAIDLDTVETNILVFSVQEGTAEDAVESLEKEGVQIVPFGLQTLRVTFHFQVDDDDLKKVIAIFQKLF